MAASGPGTNSLRIDRVLGLRQDPDDVYAEHRRESDLYNIVGRRILAADHVIGKAQLDG
jgi:hypothetical protein